METFTLLTLSLNIVLALVGSNFIMKFFYEDKILISFGWLVVTFINVLAVFSHFA